MPLPQVRSCLHQYWNTSTVTHSPAAANSNFSSAHLVSWSVSNCLPLTHILAMLTSPSKHVLQLLVLYASSTPLLSEHLPILPTWWTRYPALMTAITVSQAFPGTLYLNSFMITIPPLFTYLFPTPTLLGIPWGQSSGVDMRERHEGTVQRAVGGIAPSHHEQWWTFTTTTWPEG